MGLVALLSTIITWLRIRRTEGDLIGYICIK